MTADEGIGKKIPAFGEVSFVVWVDSDDNHIMENFYM